MSMVWVHMLPLDNRLTTGLTAASLQEARVRHFHDPHKRAAKALAEGLGHAAKILWDAYLFYLPGSEWDDGPPAPAQWAHQLGASWADRAHYHHGDDLVAELHKAMSKLTISPQDA